MKCQEVQPQLSLLLDDELDELNRERVLRHIKKCASCNQELLVLAKAVRIVQAINTVEPPRDYCDLFKKMEEE